MKKYILSIMMLAGALATQAQEAPTTGFLLPRMTTAQKTALVNPAKGLTIYNTDTNVQEINTGTAAAPVWSVVGTASSLSSKFTNDAANTRVALTNLSDGTTARPTGTEFLISDNGNLTIGKSIPNIYKISVKGTTNNNTGGLAEFTNSDNATIFSLRNDGKIAFVVPNLPANINQNVSIRKDIDNSTIAPAPWTSTTATALTLSNQFGSPGTVGTSVGVHFALYDGEHAFIDAERKLNDFVNLRFGFRTSFTGSYVQRMVVNSDGNVGIGTTTPTEKLEVNGAIKIGETSAATPTAGTIRFNTTTSKFEGYDGTAWVAFH